MTSGWRSGAKIIMGGITALLVLVMLAGGTVMEGEQPAMNGLVLFLAIALLPPCIWINDWLRRPSR